MQEKPGQFLVDDFYLWDYNSSATRWLSLGSNQYLISIMLLLVYSFIIKIPSKSNPIPIKIPSLELSTLKAKTTLYLLGQIHMGFPGGSNGKESTRNAGDLVLIPGSGRSPGEGHGNPFQYCLENPMDRGAWCATVHEVAESDTTEVT